jgi:hypothetical protein
MMVHLKNKSPQQEIIVDNKHSSEPLIRFLINGSNTLYGTLYKRVLFTDYIVPDNFRSEDGVTNIFKNKV